MKPNKEYEENLESSGDQKGSNGQNDNFALSMDSEPVAKDMTIDNQSTELYFTLHIYKEFKLKIYRPLLQLKFALLFWFAGAIGIQAFFSVFLKQRGLSVGHMSLVTAASVVFQLLGASLSGVISDKIGRAKPVLFFHISSTILVSVIFLLLPPLTFDGKVHQFQLHSSDNDSIPRLIAETWCNASKISDEENTCKLYYSTNTNFNSKEEHCFSFNSMKNNAVSPMKVVDNNANVFGSITVCYHEIGSIKPSNISYTFCNFTNCKFLEKECTSKIGKCSNWDSKTILLFSVYALLITIHYMSHSCVFRFLDVTSISLTAEHNANFGKQRVLSIVGALIGPSLIGYVLQVTSGKDKNYSLAFVFYISFTILSALASWNINIRVREPEQEMWKAVLRLLKKSENVAFIFVLLVLGTSFNFMIIFSNWYLEDLGASKLLLGLLTPLSSVFALFSLYTYKWWLRNIGEHNLFILALVGYAFFNVSYSFIIEPWYAVLIGVVVYTFSYHLLWVAVIQYAHTLAPDGLYATVIVMAGVLHYVVSRMTASLIGGMIMDAYGGRFAFRIMGSINIVTAILYGTFRYLRRQSQS